MSNQKQSPSPIQTKKQQKDDTSKMNDILSVFKDFAEMMKKA